ncbi:hypothetical protein Godav_000874, partial [Gossypium davidsonii]|nr:hypothetical protein [Gossypium davidsonii]
RVGTGKDIKIEDDVWAPEAEGIKIKQTVSKPNITRVADLIDSDTRSWRVGLVLNTFVDNDARRILRIPLAKYLHDDFMTMIRENIPSVFAAKAITCVQEVIVGRDWGITHAEIERDSLK